MDRDLNLSGFKLHPQRGAVLGEVHARPFTRLTAPLSVLRFAFLNQGDAAMVTGKALWRSARRTGLPRRTPAQNTIR